MKKNRLLAWLCVLLMITGALMGCTPTPPATSEPAATENAPAPAQTEPPAAPPEPTADTTPVTLNFATAGDTNMMEFFQNMIVPEFNKEYPHISVNIAGTGAGDSGSKTIHTKLRAQLDAGKEKWDLDAACVNQSVMRDLIADGLIMKFVDQLENGKYVNTVSSKNALGTPVEGYVVPLFQSQVVIAYNPAMVASPPKTFAELETWIKENPNKFGYNGVTGGMSGVGFTIGYVYYKTGMYDTFSKGVYDVANEATWPDVIKELKSLPVVYTQGNAGTLDMLNRGEIAMGPVWVDMFYLWKSDGRMDPNMKMILPEPGLPGQPMYLVVSTKGENQDAAKKFIDFIARPEIQAKYVVEASTWYPGIDANAVFEVCSDEAKTKLFSEVTSEELAAKGLTLMLTNYQADLLKTYEEVR